MAKAGTKRIDPRSEATRLALIEAAESLFAEFGFEAVSMRQIGAAIGSGNTRVVAYHFGTMEDFIEAIYRHRLPAMDERRRQLLNQADADGCGQDLVRLFRIIGLPLFEQTDANGLHSYGRFLCAMRLQGKGPTRSLIDDPFPVTTQIWSRILSKLPIDSATLGVRLRILDAMMLAAFQLIDAARGPQAKAKIFEDSLAMSLSALRAPAGKPGDQDSPPNP